MEASREPEPQTPEAEENLPEAILALKGSDAGA